MTVSQGTAALDRQWFARSALAVAPDLLGKYLVGNGVEGMITEVEAYDGPKDLACHGRFGPTKRTQVMFGPAGVWYVYLCYGMHWMLNVVCAESGYPAAVLIRGVRKSEQSGKSGNCMDGPGKVTAAFGVDQSLNGLPTERASGLWIEDRGVEVPRSGIKRLPRIGVDYAGAWAKKPYRFLIEQGTGAV